MENKKGMYTVSSLGALAIALVVASIVIAIGAEILTNVNTEVQNTTTAWVCDKSGDTAFNATCGGLAGTSQFGDWLDTIALIIVAAVVIGIIASSFGQQQ